MVHGMKETCTEAMREDATGHTCMIWSFLPLRTMHMIFTNFPKLGVNFHDFSRPGKQMEFHDFSRFSMTSYTLHNLS